MVKRLNSDLLFCFFFLKDKKKYMYINIYCTDFLCGKKENGQALIKGCFFFKTWSLGRDTGRSNRSTCTATTGNARVASLDVRAGTPWWSGVAQQCGFLQSFHRWRLPHGCCCCSTLRERDWPEGVCSPPSAPSARRTGDWTARWKSRLSCLCVWLKPVCLSVCCACSGYVDASLLRLLQPLGLLLHRWRVGSLGGCAVQRVGPSAHQRGDGAAHRGHHMLCCHVFWR